MRLRIGTALVAAITFGTFLSSEAAADDGWSFKLTPYALAPFIDGDAGIGRLQSIGIAVDPVDILDRLQLGLMLYGEALHDSGWGATLDYAFMDLADSGTFAGGTGTADVGIFQGTLTGSVFRRVVNRPDQNMDVYAGFRWWDMDIDVDATLGGLSPSVRISEDWVDPHFGLRGRTQLNNSRWWLTGQADIGGFGLSSDFAWTAQVGVVWQRDDRFSIEMSYKAIGVDYETGVSGTPGYFKYDTITHGPVFGLSFAF